jgi:2-oxo-3-hexenedioate decarboxylase
MASSPKTADLEATADAVLASFASHRQIAPFSSQPGGLTLDQAYQVIPLLRPAFEARGETVVGRKIGFTNRDMWAIYDVHSPVWGYVTDRTAHELAGEPVLSVQDFIEPRIEPEIIFGLKAAPSPGMSEEALLDCIAWLSLGYEVVQSIFPDWKFSAVDTVAANGVHAALLIGARQEIAARKREWQQELSTFTAELYCNGQPVQKGGGGLVLGSPLLALRHLVDLLAADPYNPPLRADEVVTTGTLTLAMPVRAGETWTTTVSGIPLEPVSLRFK